ncbi:MAG: chemotaxis protein CheW [Spongiibacteraceae bacterium]
MPNALAPFEYLLELAQRGQNLQRELSVSHEHVDEIWTGIGFRVCGQDCVAPTGDIVEVVTSPLVTRLPGVKNWVLGIANVRGRLLPVVDLGMFLAGVPAKRSANQRVLVIECGDIYLGLIVEEVFGMQRLDVVQYGELEADTVLQRFVDGVYRQDDREWMLFKTDKLIADDEFYNVAV